MLTRSGAIAYRADPPLGGWHGTIGGRFCGARRKLSPYPRRGQSIILHRKWPLKLYTSDTCWAIRVCRQGDKTAVCQDKTAVCEDKTAVCEDKTAVFEDKTAVFEDKTARIESANLVIGGRERARQAHRHPKALCS